MTKIFNVICIKWGNKYTPDDVNKLYAAICRNTSYDIRFFCFTEQKDGLSPEIIRQPLPNLDMPQELIFGNHRKASGLCDDNLAGLYGQRVFFFDLDSLIVGNLDALFDYPEGDKFYAINDWAHRHGKKANKIGQASCYSWVVGTLGYIKAYYEQHPEEVKARFGTATQQYVSAKVIEKYGKLNFWPDEWFKSFRFHCLPHPLLRYILAPKMPNQPELKMIAFHGEPGIPEALRGIWSTNPKSDKYPRGWKKLYKHVRPSLWIADYWK